MEALVLLSGGIDSALCAHLLDGRGFNVRGLFVDYGQAALDAEQRAATRTAKLLEIELLTRQVTGGGIQPAGEIVGRNALLLSLGVCELGKNGGLVAIGVHAGTSYYDCSIPFIDSMAKLIEEQTDGKTSLIAPLLTWSKAQIFDAFAQAGLSIETTYSCEASSEPCGECLSCADRRALAC
jgi:7-cyano-7-deazaguanine synthase